MRVRTTIAAVVLAVVACGSLAADWPQYLGPDRNSTSPEKGLLRAWPEGGPEVLWTVSVDRGYGLAPSRDCTRQAPHPGSGDSVLL